MEISTSHPRYHYFFWLHLKRVNYWLEEMTCVTSHVSVSKELRMLKVTPRFTKNVKEMLKYGTKGS